MPQTSSDTDLKSTSQYGQETAETNAAISEAETEYAINARLYDARRALVSLKRNISIIHTIYSIYRLTYSIYCAIINLLLNFVQFQNEKHTLFKFVRSQEV